MKKKSESDSDELESGSETESEDSEESSEEESTSEDERKEKEKKKTKLKTIGEEVVDVWDRFNFNLQCVKSLWFFSSIPLGRTNRLELISTNIFLRGTSHKTRFLFILFRK